MAAGDEESAIQLSRFLYRVFDTRNRAVLSEWMKFGLCSTEMKVMEVKDKWTVELKRMCEVNLDLKCTTDQTRGGRGSVGIWTWSDQTHGKRGRWYLDAFRADARRKKEGRYLGVISTKLRLVCFIYDGRASSVLSPTDTPHLFYLWRARLYNSTRPRARKCGSGFIHAVAMHTGKAQYRLSCLA